MNLTQLFKKMIGRGAPPAKFLTPDGKPREEVKAKPKAPPPPKPWEATPKTKPFRIMYVITKSNFGGAQRYVYDLVSHIPPDVEPIVLCGTAGGIEAGAEAGILAMKLREIGVRTVILPELTRDIGITDVAALYKLWKVIRAWQPDVLHLNSSKAGGLGALAGRLAGVKKIIFTAHGWPFNEQRSFLWRSFAWFASAATVLLSSKTICVSTYDLKQMSSLLSWKLVGVRNAVPPGEYLDREDVRPNVISHSDLYKDDIWVATIGELNQNKNVELGVRAVAAAIHAGYNIFYAVIGDGEDRFRLEDIVTDELKLDQNIKILGFISDAPKLLKAFDIFLLPSRKEGMPYVILEALKSQTPILATAVGGIPEVVRDGENGILVQSENLEQMSEALIRLCKDQELRYSLTKAEAPQHFEAMLRETFAQYR